VGKEDNAPPHEGKTEQNNRQEKKKGVLHLGLNKRHVKKEKKESATTFWITHFEGDVLREG